MNIHTHLVLVPLTCNENCDNSQHKTVKIMANLLIHKCCSVSQESLINADLK